MAGTTNKLEHPGIINNNESIFIEIEIKFLVVLSLRLPHQIFSIRKKFNLICFVIVSILSVALIRQYQETTMPMHYKCDDEIKNSKLGMKII